jgi:CheY-like chemotaxis protein
MTEPLIWIFAAALTIGVVVLLLWLGRRRQQRARDATAHREAQRVLLEQAEHAARAQRVASDLAGTTVRSAESQQLRDVEAGIAQRLGEQRAEAAEVEAGRARVERDEDAQREARAQAAQAAREAREAAEAEERRQAELRAQAEREAAAQAEALAQRQAAEAAQAEAEAREMQAREAQRLAQEQLEQQARQEREAAERLEAERLQAEREREEAAWAAAEQEKAQRLEAERLEAERAAAAAEAASAAEALPETTAATRELRADETLVLVADDSKIVRVKISRLLAGQGYRVALADSGEQAEELLAAERPHLLITDVEMPGIDGFELTRRVRATPATAALPVVMITSSDDKREAAAEAGVTQLLGKPYSEEALIAAIEQARLAVRVPA